MIRAPHDLFGRDGLGVRRRIRAGDLIPPGMILEEPLPPTPEPPELEVIARDKARRRGFHADAGGTSDPPTKARRRRAE